MGGTVTEIGWDYKVDLRKERRGDTLVKYQRVDCLLDRSATWATPGHRTPDQLRYHQVAFDLAESCARQMQRGLYYGPSAGPGAAMSLSAQPCDDRLRQFQKATRNGQDTLMVAKWAANVELELELESLVAVPGQDLVPGAWNYGMHLVAGYGLFGGDLQKHFSEHFNVGYGFDLGYKRATLLIAGILGGTHVRLPMPLEERWVPNQRLGLAILDLSGGFVLVDRGRLRVAPTLGLGLHALSSKITVGNEQISIEHEAWGPMYGLNVELKIRKVLELTAPSVFMGGPTYNETLVRIRLFGMQSNFGEEARGFTPGLSVGVYWMGRVLKPKGQD